MVLFAVSDANYKFILVDVGAKGRESDGGVFERSDFGQLFLNSALDIPPPVHSALLGEDIPYVFVGDDAFPLHDHLMKPYSNDTCKPEERIFNYRLSRARRVVENAFGILSARYRVFRKNMLAGETFTQNVILASVALHNLHMMHESTIPPKDRVYAPPGFADVYKSNGVLKPGRWRNKAEHEEESLFAKLALQEVPSDTYNVEDPEYTRDKFVELCVADYLPWQWNLVPKV